MEEEASGRSGPIISHYACDPDMVDLVAMFLEELPQRMAALTQAVQKHDLELARDLSHQLKGAAGGYGFPQIGEAAAALEASAKAAEPVDVLAAQLREIADLCARSSASALEA